MNVAIHKRLELAINASGLTDDQIRKKAEISKSRYHELKKGDGHIKEHTLGRLCIALNISADWLLFGKGTMKGE